jgi:signal transduction histidine kinase
MSPGFYAVMLTLPQMAALMDDSGPLHIKLDKRKARLNKRSSNLKGKNSHQVKKKYANVDKLFLQLLTNYPEGSISIIDKNFQVIYTGGELYQQLQKDPLSWSGKNILSMFPATLQKRIESELSQVFFGKIVSDLELRDCCFAEHSYTMDAFPLVEDDNSVKRAGIIIRNITRLKQAEEGFRMALEKEKELGELKSRFVSMASHEFRTPLSTILTSAYLLSKYITTEEQPKRDKHLERIISSVNTLTDILNDFLSLGKMEEGKIFARAVSFNVRELITGIVNEMAPIEKKGQTIQYEHEGEEMVMLDKGLLKQIVLNLLSNAIKFSSDETQIEVRTVHHADALELSVKDYGMGISKGDQKHLFERFFRGANAMNIQGTGLGLHIVARYAELMNGNVTYKSELEKGSEFIVTFQQSLLRR